MNITDPVHQHAGEQPDAVAIICPNDDRITYQSLNRHINRLARHVRDLGFRPRDMVGLSIAGPDEATALILALALARAGVASGDVDMPAKYLAAVFTQASVPDRSDVRSIRFDGSWLTMGAIGDAPGIGIGDAPDDIFSDGDAICRVFSTSGTTGRPRYCPFSHRIMAARIAAGGFPLVSGGRPPVLICALGLGGSWGLRTVLATLAVGGTLVFTHRAGLMNAVLRHGVTSLATSPNALQAIVSGIPAGFGPLPKLQAVLVGGSHLPPLLARAASERLCPNIMTGFGATETGSVCRGRFDAVAAIPLGVGALLPGVTVQAVDSDDAPLPAETSGQLRIRSPGMIAGYLDDAEATTAAFRDGWFYSGDVGSVTPEGVMIVTGRIGDYINSGGVKVDPGIIERVLMEIPGVTQAAAFGVPDADGLAQIWAAIVSDASVPNTVLDRICSEKLGARAPKFVLQMRDLPRGPHGKVVTAELIDTARGIIGAEGWLTGRYANAVRAELAPPLLLPDALRVGRVGLAGAFNAGVLATT